MHSFLRIVRPFRIQPLGLLMLVLLMLALPASLWAETPSASVQNGPRTSLKLLHIGNSFSVDATKYLPGLARAGGKDLTLHGVVIGGSSMKVHVTHLEQAKAGDPAGSPYAARSFKKHYPEAQTINLMQALSAEPWDVVTIQQASIQSNKPETYEPYAGILIGEIRSLAPQASIMVHQTWAYRLDASHFRPNPETLRQEMYEGLTQAYDKLAKHYQLGLLPSGNAIELAIRTPRWQFKRDPDFDYGNPPADTTPVEDRIYLGSRWVRNKAGQMVFATDTKHLGPAGQYLAACVWYEVLFNDSVLHVDYVPDVLTAEEAADLRQIAHQAVAEFREHGLKGAPASVSAN